MYDQEDTIAAIATPYAQGGIGIIKISGPEAKAIAQEVFVPAKPGASIQKLPGYHALFGQVVCNGKLLDEGILLNFNAPKSYTGEDVVEISVHSGLFILKQVLRAVLAAGARLAEPGEFSKRAFLNGKISLTEAESISNLISAGTQQAHAAALALKQGKLSALIESISNDLLAVISQIAAFIDYPEEDVTPVDLERLHEQTNKLHFRLFELLQSYDTGQLLRDGVLTAIVGKPNVGKSTLMNLLSGCERSIVSQVPGTTRDLVESCVNLDGILLNIADTAGLRETTDPVEKIGTKLAWQKLQQAYLLLAVFDASRPVDEYDYELLSKLNGKKVIGIINKTDLPIKLNCELIKSKIACVVEGCAQNEEVLGKLSAAIKAQLPACPGCGCVLANERQRLCVQQAISHLKKAMQLIKTQTLDIVGIELEEALSALMQLNGKNVSEAIIDEVFSRFCVGK